MYLFHPLMDRTEEMIWQHLYWNGIRNYARKEVNNVDTCQRTKQSNIKYGKLPGREAEEIPGEKICVDLVFTYVIRRRDREKN